MIWALVLVCQLAWTLASQGVFHERSGSWITVPVKKEAYFGYSITYIPTSKRLIVSAPQEDNIGEIYSCDMTVEKPVCPKLKKNTFRSTYPQNYWLGATVKAGPSYFVTCSPLLSLSKTLEIYKKQKTRTYKNENITMVGTFSRCYKYTDLDSNPVTMTGVSDKITTLHATLFEHAMDSYGWSIDVDGDDIIIGGPAMFTGRVLQYNYDKSQTRRDSRPAPKHVSGFMNQNVGTNYNRRVDYNFGYSVAVGYFTTLGNKKSYAIGSPYGKMGFGKVVFYAIRNNRLVLNDAAINSKLSKRNEDLQTKDEFAVGSMFGAALCAAQLAAGSPATALLVGAPTYASLHRYNQGAVYVYPPADNLPLQECSRNIVGPKDGGFFGSAIVRLGDYNGDGLDEIAIAAPYEASGIGAVYIFSGADVINKDGDITWMQRIDPKPFGTAITRSFGLSLTAIQDYDDNGCNELAIGAPHSNKVLVMKCIASVTANLYADIPKDLSLRPGNPFRTEDHFTFQSCLKLSYPEKPNVIYARINVNVQIEHSDATLQPSDKHYEVILSRAEKVTCKTITVLAPKNGNYQRPISYRINAVQLDHPDESEFNSSHVALTDRSTLTYSGFVLLAECDDVEHCKPDLKLTKTISVTPPYVIGSSEKIRLGMSVSNGGEAAYEACVQVFGAGVTMAGVPRGCERLHGRVDALLCKPSGALRKEDNAWEIPEVSFDTSRLNSEHKLINISIALYNDCKQDEPAWQHVLIPLQTDSSNIFIKGITDSGISNSVNMSKGDIDGQTFEHSYTISSGALTNWVNVEVEVVRQSRSFIAYDPIYISSDNSQSEQCPMSAENDTIFNCLINELNSKQSVKITVPMKVINAEMLETAISQKENTQFTSFTLKLNAEEQPKTSSVTTTFNLGGQLKIWIIVVASLVALLILLLLFFLLRKCGFFKREKKQKLANVRQSVRRQTMMRRTMMEGGRLPPGEDRRTLLASVSQETADQAAARDKRVRLNSDATRNKLN